MARILVVDDEPDLLDTLRRILVKADHDVLTCGSGGEAIVELEQAPYDLVLTDLMMPEVDGLAVLDAAREKNPDAPVLLMTAYATLENAVQAMRRGAWDFVPKPFSAGQLRAVVDRALDHARLAEENKVLRARLAVRGPANTMVAHAPAMRVVEDLVGRVAPTDLTVLITGESGTGKEVVARALHDRSRRAGSAFVPVDCAAIPANLMESELFGHERGAFTGATTARKGLVEEADGGTFFLDEIAELETSVQTKLLRLLQDHEYRRVGGNKLLKADLRVVAATNRDLEVEVAAGRFREDLFHRLNVVRVRLPPLRERPEDVLPLLQHFLARFRAESGRAALSVSPAAMAVLTRHGWPGNVRELSNCARYLVGLARGPEAGVDDLPPALRATVPTPPPSAAPAAPSGDAPPLDVIRPDLPYKTAKRLWSDWFDERYLQRLLDAHGGNISAAARATGIDRKSIQRMLKRGGTGGDEEIPDDEDGDDPASL